jgi:hypothetical protein
MSKLNADQLLDRLEWRREIRNTMGRISHDLCVKEDAEIYNRYWSKREDVSLLLNQGGFQGAKAVAGYYQSLGDEIALSSKLIYEKFPDAFPDQTLSDVYGVGSINYMPLDSQVIEIAQDGQTAKAIFNVRGSYCYLTPGGPVSNWTYGWLAADLIMEDGAFKVWHMQLLYQVDHPCGSNFVDTPAPYPAVEGFEKMADFQPAQPNVEGGMEHYHALRAYQKSPAVPEPYDTFTDTFSYGI